MILNAWELRWTDVLATDIFGSSTTQTEVPPSKFDPTGVRIHDLQTMTAHFMSLRRPYKPLKKMNVVIIRLTTYFMCDLLFDLVISDLSV